MAATVEERVTEEAEMLNDLAALAKQGIRKMVVIGKVKTCRTVPAKEGGTERIYVDLISGEGDTLNVDFISNGHRPYLGQCGAFVVSPRMYQGKLSGFTVTEFSQ